MIAPRRLLDEGGTAVEMALLRSAKGDGPPAGALERAMANLAASGAARSTGAPGSGITPGANLARWVVELFKWMAIGVMGGALFHGEVGAGGAPRAADPSTITRADVSEAPRGDTSAEVDARTTDDKAAAEEGSGQSEAPAAEKARPAGNDRQKQAARGPSAPAAARAPSLAEEIALLDSARRALTKGDTRAALAALDTHAQTFPSGSLRPEAAVLRVDVMVKRGERAAAAEAAKAILEARPTGPYAGHLRSIAGSAGAPEDDHGPVDGR